MKRVILAALLLRGAAWAGPAPVRKIAPLPRSVSTQMALQLDRMAPKLGNAHSMSFSLAVDVTPKSPRLIEAEPEALASAYLLKRALTDPAAFEALQSSLAAEPELRDRVIKARESIAADPRAYDSFAREFGPIEMALEAEQPLEKLGRVINGFFDGSVELSDRALDEAAAAAPKPLLSRLPGPVRLDAPDGPPSRKLMIGLSRHTGLKPPTAAMKPGPWIAEPGKGDVLFVCTGNTCRSPMAESAFNELARKKGADGVKAISRGMVAPYVLKPDGHEAKQLTIDEVKNARLILTMDEINAVDLVSRYPEAAGKTFLLKEYAGTGTGDVRDPVGGEYQRYWEASQEIFAAVEAIWTKIGEPAAPAAEEKGGLAWPAAITRLWARRGPEESAPNAAGSPGVQAPVSPAKLSETLDPRLPIGTVHVRFRPTASPDPKRYAEILNAVQSNRYARRTYMPKSSERWEASMEFGHAADAQRAVAMIRLAPEIEEIRTHPRLDEVLKRVSGEFPKVLGEEEKAGTVRVRFAEGVQEWEARYAVERGGDSQLIMAPDGRFELFAHFLFPEDAARAVVKLRGRKGVAAVTAHAESLALAEKLRVPLDDGKVAVLSTLEPSRPIYSLRVSFDEKANPSEVLALVGAGERPRWDGDRVVAERSFEEARPFADLLFKLRDSPLTLELEVRPEVGEAIGAAAAAKKEPGAEAPKDAP